MDKIWVLHGPNLNLLGQREPDRYGHTTLAQINASLAAIAAKHGVTLQCHQHNAEHELVELIHQAGREGVDAIVFNPAAFTHTSIALRDALLGVDIAFIEVHISNIFAREAFRTQSYFSDIAIGVISGVGVSGYEFALQAAIAHIKSS